MSFKRVLAIFGLVLSVSLAPVAPAALAQSAPQAAPVGEGAQAQPLDAPTAAPAGDVEIGSSTAPAGAGNLGDISIVSLFWRADPLVKAVFVLLVAASLWSWTIIISKWIMLGSIRRKGDAFEKTFWSGLSLDELYTQFSAKADHPMATVFTSALREWRRAFEGGAPREAVLPSIKDRIEKAMNVTILRE